MTGGSSAGEIMFWYQCRYCKVNFDQWEKLVTHRRDEHVQEFEALKRRSALLLKRQEEADTTNKLIRLETRRKASELVKTLPSSAPLVCTSKMKPTSSSTSPNLSSLASCSTRNQNSFSKELDAKDLENQEISLCIPSSSLSLRSSAVSPPFERSSTPPFSFPTPSPSPRMNGNNNRTPRSSSKSRFNGNNDHSIQHSSFPTPPVTPSRLSLASSSCPTLSADELATNVNWLPPADLKKVVQYHQMSDDDEIEICVIPSAGSCISVTKHLSSGSSSSSSSRTVTRPPPPYATNGGGGVGLPNIYLNGDDQSTVLSRQQQISNSHVVIENLEDELRMTCSNSNDDINGPDRGTERQQTNSKTTSATAALRQGVRRRSHVEMLRSTGQRLKRLHSQLQQRQNQQQIKNRNLFASHSTSSASSLSTTLADPNSDNATKRIRSSNSANDENRTGIQSERSNRTSSNNNTSTSTTPRFSRYSTRASPRRPK